MFFLNKSTTTLENYPEKKAIYEHYPTSITFFLKYVVKETWQYITHEPNESSEGNFFPSVVKATMRTLQLCELKPSQASEELSSNKQTLSKKVISAVGTENLASV